MYFQIRLCFVDVVDRYETIYFLRLHLSKL